MSCVHTASHPERGLARPRPARVQGREPPSRSGGPSANRTLRNEPSESRGQEGRREAKAASGRRRGQRRGVACGPHRSRGRICAAHLLFPLVQLSSVDSLFPLCQPAEVQSPAREAPGLPAKEDLGE